MTPHFKFGWKPEEPQQYEYSNVWSREKTTGPERLVIAPSSDHISLMIELSRIMTEPFGFLYVLTVPRGQGEAGRYQNAEPIGRLQAEGFLSRFKQFFENDGRHNLWLASVSNSDLLVYDKHNVIYAYGQLPCFEKVLSKRGMEKVDEIHTPSPHIHEYNPEFDEDELDVLHYWEWKQFPLREIGDN
jgi:hypothetical protein